MSDHILLSGSQTERLYKAILTGFNPDELRRLLAYRFNNEPTYAIPASPQEALVFELIEWFIRRAWERRLVVAILEARPNHPLVAEIAQELLTISFVGTDGGTIERRVFERMVRKNCRVLDIGIWAPRLTTLIHQVCRISIPVGASTAFGTGFLIGPDLVLTNHHVVESLEAPGARPDFVEVAFDYMSHAGLALSDGTIAQLAEPWCVAKSPYSPEDEKADGEAPLTALDYAVIRLSTKIGEETIGKSPPGSTPRGYISLPAAARSSPKDSDVFIMQHAASELLGLSFGRVLATNGNGTRLRYDATTAKGSSGSPVLTDDLEIVALHHAGDPLYARLARYNQGVPIHLIRADLAAKKII